MRGSRIHLASHTLRRLLLGILQQDRVHFRPMLRVAGWRPARTAHTKHLLSSLWTLTIALRPASFEGVGRYVAPYRGWYAAMWMVMFKTASNVHPDPSAIYASKRRARQVMAASTAASMSSATRTVMTSERRTGSLVWTVPSTSTRDMRRVVVT